VSGPSGDSRSSACGEPAVAADETPVSHYRDCAMAANTRRAYGADLRHFVAHGGFLPEWEGAPRALPEEEAPGTPPEQLAIYLAECASALRMATLRRRVAAVNSWNALADCPPPGHSPAVRRVLQGIARTQGREATPEARAHWRTRQAHPLRHGHIAQLLAALGSELRDVRDRALMLLAWTLGTRRSELTRLRLDDLQFDSDGLSVRIDTSKTDPEGRGTCLGIPRIDAAPCAVTALEAWLQAAGIHDGPVFRRVDRWGNVGEERLHDDSLSVILRARLLAAGVPGAGAFSSHSFRAGLITDTIAAGEIPAEVQERSRHCSHDVFQSYIRGLPDRPQFVSRMLERAARTPPGRT